MAQLAQLLFVIPWLFVVAFLYALFSISSELRTIRKLLEAGEREVIVTRR